jgi:DNA modification methylase
MKSIRLIYEKFEDVLPDNIGSVQLTFMDPPDCEGRSYNGYDDKMPDNEYVDLLIGWTRKACEITDGPVFLSVAEKWMNEIEELINRKTIKLIRRIVWHYTFGQNNKKSYSPCFRPIYWLNKNIIYPKEILVPSARQEKYGDKRANLSGKMPSNVWEFSRICGTFKERRKWHPTQFPEALMKRIILGHSKPGDTVLDPFVGSGTTAIVCQATNRNCVGIDQSQFYIEQIREELDARNQTIP